MKFHCLAAASLAALLTASCGDCCTEGQDPATSSSLGLSASGVSAVPMNGSPEAAFTAAMQGLKGRKLSQFISLMAPSGALGEMKSGWEMKRKQKLNDHEDQEFRQFMGMLTADGAEAALFLMAKPQLEEAQQQLAMMASMAPMMAAGAIQESGAPADTMALLEPVAAKFASLDIASEEKCKEAIGVLCKAARAMELESLQELQKLDFDDMMGKADIAYGMMMDVLAVYDISFDEALNSMEVKTVSMENGAAQMEVTMMLFGKRTSPIPFEMVKGTDGRWTMPDEGPEDGTVDEGQPGLAR